MELPLHCDIIATRADVTTPPISTKSPYQQLQDEGLDSRFCYIEVVTIWMLLFSPLSNLVEARLNEVG